ncbi:MAG: RDD family protein [Elusimicrobiota bacterium]
MENISTPRRADFAERALAFAVDGALFAAGWALTLKALAPHVPLPYHPKGPAALLIWGALFLGYQAYFSSEGRVTLGKRLFGLRVVGADGEPLGLVAAAGRSFGYLISQFFTAGFLWALIDSNGRAWHDLPFGSLVVAEGGLSGGRRFAVRLAAGGLLTAFAGVWGWQNIWAPRYERIMTVAGARGGLDEFAALQESYKRVHGRYAENMFALAQVSVDPTGFLRDTAALYDQGRVAIRADRDHYAVVARANDVEKTLVAISGP